MVEQGKMAMTSSSSAAATNQSASTVSYHPYPQALARYEDVVASGKLFMDTLGKLHATMGTKFMIPVIGGKDLDLHHLFVEVTSRGGIGRVLGEKKWKEVTATFSFPSSATNASFILRKYYLSLLQHYEQVYYFKAKGWTESADASHKVPTVSASCHGMDSSVFPLTNVQETPLQPQMDTAQTLPAVVPAPPTVIGVIDAKFESGYLVTVMVGSETLRGVLYQTPQNAAADQVKQNMSTGSKINETTATTGVQRRKRRKKCEMKKRDPAHPKPNRSGYNFFFAEQHARLKPLYPGKDRDISRMIGELWNKLNEPGKAVYQEKAVRDKERYRIEMDDYRERLKMGQVVGTFLPIQQQPPVIDINMIDGDENIETECGNSPQTPENESSSGKSDKSNLFDSMTANRDRDMGKSLRVDIGAHNVHMETLVDEKALELQKKVVENGREGEEFLGANDQMELQKSAHNMETESEKLTQSETVAIGM
ncbi:High mobility group B protein 15 [Heracleum sosnowskyi]|uniref:High mobility group B protein 15 n=1 Tax=Heracleum sosnowskyi TaxID=360622 RepID=A0AAD8I8W9_9APIA|nr:High mobility group B protein 15 [Heracleum sosnowskyi]